MEKKSNAGAPKKIKSPEMFWALYQEYKYWVEDNPILVHDFVGKDGKSAHREKKRPLTIEGFENYLEDNYGIGTIQQYLENREGRYQEFVSTISRVRREIRQDQIEGSMVGIYNPNLTARIQGIADNVNNNTNTNVKLLSIDPLNPE